MTEVVQNEPTKASPISKGYARTVVKEFMDLYWPALVTDKLAEQSDYEFGVEDLEKLVAYAAWRFRGNGSPDESHQVVKGWSKLTYRVDHYTPGEDKIEEIKARGATA